MGAPRVTLGAVSLGLSGSGIERVARLMGRALAEACHEGQIDARAVSFGDVPAGEWDALPTRSARGSRLRFVASMQRAALTDRALLFDFAGMARARPRLPRLPRLPGLPQLPGPFRAQRWPGLRPPFLTWLHGIEAWEGAAEHHLASLRAADVLLANTRYTAQRAARLHRGLEHARVCWLATEHDEPAPQREALDSQRVLIVGRMDASEGYKGHLELIRAWPTVLSAAPRAELVIVGRGSGSAGLQREAASSSARDRIRFTGFVPDQELEGLWSSSALLAMPSRGEGFGLTYVEAMRRGLPVVASVHDAAPEINVDGVTGYNVDLDRSGELAERLVELVRSPERSRAMGEAGRQRWQAHFCFSAFRQRFTPMLQDLLRAG